MRIRTDFIYDEDTDMVEIIKQEIVDDDKDWNLTSTIRPVNRIVYSEGDADEFEAKNVLIYNHVDVKKCYDLILKDLYEMDFNPFISEKNIIQIIKNRFGDLK